MTCSAELRILIDRAAARGATIRVEYDSRALIEEGRMVEETVQVRGLKGCGPLPMPPISAAERLRSLVGVF